MTPQMSFIKKTNDAFHLNIIRVDVGHSKVGLDGIKNGKIHIITFQCRRGRDFSY